MKQKSEGILLALPDERKVLLVSHMGQDIEKAFVRSIAIYQVLGDVGICSSNKTTCYSSYNLNHNLVKLIINHCYSPRSICLLHRPDWHAEWGCVGNHYPASFKSSVGSLIPPRIQYCFWFTILLGRGSSDDFHLAIPNILTLPPQVRESMWGFWQLLSKSIAVMHPRTREKILEDGFGNALGPL